MLNSKISITINVISLLFFCSCNESSNRLSGGYRFASSSPLSILPHPTMFDKGIDAEITDFQSDSKFILVEQTPDFKSCVYMTAFSLRSRYITLTTIDTTNSELLPGQYEFFKQKMIEDSSLYKMLSTRITTENTEQDIEVSQIIADSIIRYDPYYQDIFSRKLNYWIIAHREPESFSYLASSDVFGPFSEIEYLIKRKELGVPKELRLRFE